MTRFCSAMEKSFKLFDQLGYDTSIVYLRFKSSEEMDEIALSHAEFDGMNGFISLLQERGSLKKDGIPHIPTRRRRKGISAFVNWVRQYLRVLAQFRSQSRLWKKAHAPTSTFVSGRLLSENETMRLRTHAKLAGISGNALLLHSLHKSVEPYLTETDAPAAWIIPVMLYESTEQLFERGCRASLLEVNIHGDAPVKTLDEHIKAEIGQEAYRGTWLGAILNSFLPNSVNRWILKNTVAKKYRVGTLSNLGKWWGPTENESLGWGLVPPVHPGQPLGAAVLEYNGRLGLGLKFDASLGFTKDRGDLILNHWISRLAKEV